MRLSIVTAALAALVSAPPTAWACDPAARECLPDRVVFPAYTPEGLLVGIVSARVRTVMPLQRSRFTGQPIPVVYNNPASLPGAIDPYVERVPLPRVAPFKTQAVFPRGY